MDPDKFIIENIVTNDDGEIIVSTCSKVSKCRGFSPVDNASVTDDKSSTGNAVDSSIKDGASDSITKSIRKRRKHHQINPESWQRNRNAKCREEGKEYFGRRIKKYDLSGYKYEVVPRKKKEMKERCHCKTKNVSCTKVTDEMRQEIFDKFWALDWKEKRFFVCQNVRRINVQRPRHRKNHAVSRRSYTFQYYLPWRDKQRQVCKLMFNNTTCIPGCTALTWKNQQIENSVASTPSKSKKLDQESERLRFLNEFLEKLPRAESHTCRKDTKKLFRQRQWKTETEVYEFYKKKSSEAGITPLSSATFARLFTDNNNYSFYTKKKKG